MRRGKCPTPRPDRITSFGIAHAGHPSSHALPVRRRVGTELRRPSRGNPGGRRALSRACVQFVRPRLVRGASLPHLQRGPCGGLVQPEEAACTHTARVSTPVSARGRGERVRGTARQRAVACGALAHARPSANPNQGVQAWRVDGASGRACLPRVVYVSNLHLQGETQRTNSYGHHGHHGHP